MVRPVTGTPTPQIVLMYLLSSVLYRDNTVGGAITAFTGGIAAGSTNFSF